MWVALPLGLADLAQSAYLRTPQLAVDGVLGSAAAGQYAQAARLVEMMSLLPTLVTQGYLFSRLAARGADGLARPELRRLAAATSVLVAAALVLAAAVSLGSEPLLRLLSGGGAFAPAAAVLSVLVWAFPFTCLKDTYYVACLAQRRTHLPTVLFAVAALGQAALLLAATRAGGLSAVAPVVVGTEAGVALVMAGLYHWAPQRQAGSRRR